VRSPAGGRKHRVIGPALCALALLTATALAACGSDDSDSTTAATPASGSIGPPPARESIDEAQERIAETIDSGDCDEINALAPIASASAQDTEEHCRSLEALADLEVSDAASYGDLAGVIDYSAGDHVVSAILVRDSDGFFHIVFTNPFNRSPTVGTPEAKQFDAAVKAGLEALKEEDCEAFLEVANPRLGLGTLSKKEACQAVRASGFAEILADKRRTRLKPLGGNGSYAFYGLDTPTVYFTIVAAKASREVPASLRSSEVAKVPPGAPTYGYVQAFAVNRLEAAEAE
jgi:hypothetical protein